MLQTPRVNILMSRPLLSYVKQGRVLDLGALEYTIIPDRSPFANDATMYTGIFASSNGTTDKLVNADWSSLGSGTYYLTGKVRPSGVTTARQTLDGGSTALNLTGLTADVWQDFQTADFTGIPSGVILGWDGTNFGAADYSDIKLHDASDDSVVRRCPLMDSAAADLDGYPVFETYAGYHGTHVGGAGGSAEGIDADVRGIVGYDDKMWFDGAGVDITTTALVPATEDFILRIEVIPVEVPASAVGLYGSTGAAASGRHVIQINSTGRIFCFIEGLGGLTTTNAINLNEVNTITLTRSGTDFSLVLNGQTAATANAVVTLDTATGGSIGDPYSGINPLVAFVSLTVGATSWDGTEADAIANGWTVNGSPVTVGQKRATILQTAVLDFNTRMWFDGVDDYVELGQVLPSDGSDFTLTIDFLVPPTFVIDTPNDIIFDQSTSTANLTALGMAESTYKIRWFAGTAGTIIQSGNAYNDGLIHTARIERVSGTDTLYIDDVLIGSATAAASTPVSTNARIGNSSALTSRFIRGIISSLDVDGVEYVGTGTVNGSPENVYLAESDTTAGQDAVGNDIDNPRVNDMVINIVEDNFVQIPDDTSLESVRSITLAVYNDGGTKDVVRDALAASFVDIAANVLQTDQTGTHAYYVNGAATTTLAAGWNIVGITFDAAKDLSGGTINATSGSLIGYDPTALTAAQHLQNYNVFGPKYGL